MAHYDKSYVLFRSTQVKYIWISISENMYIISRVTICKFIEFLYILIHLLTNERICVANW